MYCIICRKRVYLVQDQFGNRFLVSNDGRRWHD